MVRLSQVSLASIGLWVGAVLTMVGGVAYSQGNSTLNLVGFFYGIPILLIGAALKSAELQPATILEAPSDQVLKLRQTQSTKTLTQVRKDVTCFRYGVSAHLDQVLEKLGLGKIDEERPVLTGLYEEVSADNTYSLVLRFSSPLISFATWQDKQDRLSRFFGPEVRAEVRLVGENLLDLHLIRTGA